MKFIRAIVFLCVVLLVFTSCNEKETIENLDFSLYKTSEMSADSGEPRKIVEENAPIMTSKDIDYYRWDGEALK